MRPEDPQSDLEHNVKTLQLRVKQSGINKKFILIIDVFISMKIEMVSQDRLNQSPVGNAIWEIVY